MTRGLHDQRSVFVQSCTTVSVLYISKEMFLPLVDLQLAPISIMSVTGHRSEKQMKADYHTYVLLNYSTTRVVCDTRSGRRRTCT